MNVYVCKSANLHLLHNKLKKMALSVTDVELLRGYINGVMARADHHAGNVKEIALALTGAIVWRKDDGIAIKVMTRDGETKNVLWVMVNGKWYTFVYNHSTGEIDMRENSTQGTTLHSFSNSTPLADVYSIFQAL
jgi:hypothetical protein